MTVLTVPIFAERWPDEYAINRRTGQPHDAMTIEQRRSMIRPFAEAFPGTQLKAVDRRKARQWAVNNPSHMRYARAMMEDALDDDLIERNPFQGLRISGAVSEGRKGIVVPTAEQVEALARAAEEPLPAMIRFAAYTGVRIGEQLALRPEDITGDFAQILRQITKDGRRKLPKGMHTRIIWIPPEAGEVPETREGESIWPLTRTPLFRRWSQVRAKVGLEDVDWHELRHFCATWLVNRGADAGDVAIQLGHSDGGNLVRSLYSHRDPELALNRLKGLPA